MLRRPLRRPRVRVRPIGTLSLNRMIPNILTLLALCAGMTAIRLAIADSFKSAVVAIIIAGIHSYPSGKDYAVSFIMSAFWEGTPAKEQDVLTAVFNSFRLLGERPATAESAKPEIPEGKKD